MNNLIDVLPILQDKPGGNMAVTLFTFAGIILVFYFFILRPQSKRQKDAQKMIEELKKFDKVVTIGGIRGIVQAVKDTTVIVKVDDNTKIEFNKNAIASVVERHEAKNEKSDTSETEENNSSK